MSKRARLMLCLVTSASPATCLSGEADGEVTIIGATHPIAEPDALEEIQAKAKQVDWQAQFRNALEGSSARNSLALPEAEQNREFSFIPWYSSEFDIPEPNTGEVLYPKGFRFNPLVYATLPSALLVIGNNERHFEWLEQQQDGEYAVLFVAGADPLAVSERLGRKVFPVTQRLMQRVGVEKIPTRIEQHGAELRVKEIALQKPGEDGS